MLGLPHDRRTFARLLGLGRMMARDVQKTFRVGGWTSQEEIQAFAQETGKLPASELAKLLPILLDRTLSSSAPTMHSGRCLAFSLLTELSPDPELFRPLVKALRTAPDATTTATLVALLPKVNLVSAHGDLCGVLGSPDENVRKAAATVLKQLAGKSAFELLFDLCKDPEFAGRVEAMDVLVPKAGHHAIPLLAAVLKSGNAPERVHALRYLVEPRFMAKDLPGAAKAIAIAIDDVDERVAAHAISALAAVVTEDEYFQALGERLESTSQVIVRAVIDGLRRFKSPRAAEYLGRKFTLGPNSVRMLVLDAFASMGDENVVPYLVEALTHRHISIRTKATEVISQLATAGRIDSARTIVSLLRARDLNVRRMATELIKKVGDRTGELAPQLLGFLRDEDWWVRERVMDALVDMAGATLARHLVEYLNDPSDVIRRFAVGGLVRLKDPRTIGTLVRAAMNDDDWWVREQAIEAVASMKDKRAIPYIIEILQRHPEQRLMCITALTTLEANEASAYVAPFAADEDPDVRFATVKCLAAIDGRDQVEVLKQLSEDLVFRVRNAARELLARWESPDIGPGEDKRMNLLDRLLTAVHGQQGDDLVLAAQRQPYVKKMGKMEPLSKTVLTEEQVRSILLPHLVPEQIADLEQGRDVDFSYEVVSRSLRFRGHVFAQRTGLGAVFRIVKSDIPDIDVLGLPSVVKTFASLKNGLVLVGGPTGSGKSTTLAAIIDSINREQSVHVLSVEDPIEALHTSKRALINQREVGTHTRSFATALRSTLRQDPDVLLIGELRDLTTISIAVTAAETGHLVFGTVHTSSADSTIDRLINAFPSGQQAQVRSMLAETLRAVVCQHLLRRIDSDGRVLAVEVMVNSDAVSNMIRKGKAFQIQQVIQSSREQGMQTMDSELVRLVKSGIVAHEEAYSKAADKKGFEAALLAAKGAAPLPEPPKAAAPPPAHPQVQVPAAQAPRISRIPMP
jgi:twitching motility protein PilT